MEELTPNVNEQAERKLTFKERIQVFIRHCHDIRVSSRVTFVVGVLFALTALLLLMFYGLEEIRIEAAGLNESENQLIGMFIFFTSVIQIVLGIVIAYFSFNNITVKHRIKVTRTIPVLIAVCEVFALILFIFCLAYQGQVGGFEGFVPAYSAGFIVTYILHWCTMIFSAWPIYFLLKNFERLYISKYKLHKGEEEE